MFAVRNILAFTMLTALIGGISSSAVAQGFNAFKDPVASSSSSGMTAGPDLKASQPIVQAGRVMVGATAYVVVLFKNNGSSPVRVTGINLYPSSNVTAKVSLNNCAETELPPEAECAVTVSVAALQLGAWRVEVLLDHNGKTRLATAAITGDADSLVNREDEQIKQDVEAIPATVDFGESAGGLPMRKAINFRNRTSETVNIKGVRLDVPSQSGLSMENTCPEKLEPGETCVVTVNWSPVTKGVAQGVLVVDHDAKSAVSIVEMTGNYEPEETSAAKIYPDSVPDRGLLISDKDKIDFGSEVNSASAITATLVNTGSSDLVIRSIRLSGSENGLSIARAGCKPGMTLAPVEACALTVNWIPSREGEVIDDLQIIHTGARGILVMPIRGSASQAVSRDAMAMRGNAAARILDTPQAPRVTPPPMTAGASAEVPAQVPAIVSAIAEYDEDDADTISLTPVLDGYKVTSHSSSRAVINGPVGSLIVRDGQDVVIAGVRWIATIVSSGVILSSGRDEVLLVFDRSLKPTRATTTSGSSSSSSSDTSGTQTTTTSATTGED